MRLAKPALNKGASQPNRAFFANSPRKSGAVWVFIIVLLAVGGISAGAWWQFKGSKMRTDASGPVVEPVKRGPFDHIVLEQGEIESSENVEVKCSVQGRGGAGTPILWVIDEGTYVKKGDKLVELDSSALDQEIKSQRIILSSAEATVISSEAAVKQAEIARQEYLEGTYLTERKAILSEVAVAQQDLRKAELSLASAERLAAKGTLKTLQIEAEQFAVQNARNQLEAAQGRLRVLDELTKAKMLVQFESDIETAKAKLDSDRSVLQEEQLKLVDLEKQISACVILSPADGQVVHANKFSGRGGSEFIVEAGAMVREQQTIINLPDPTMMQVKAKINESRITLIRDGMAAKIKVAAAPNDMVGVVTKVNKYAEPGSWFSSSVKEYATFVQIKNPPEIIRTGMTAEVRIFVEQQDNALQVPVKAIYESQNRHFVLIRNGDSWETRQIEIGATNEQFITIEDGLEEGELVVLNPRDHSDLFEIPKFEEVIDTEREELKKIGENVSDKPAVDPSKRGEDSAGSGRPPGGGFGSGGPGGGGRPDASAIAGMVIQRMDTDSDGKISEQEAAVDDRMKAAFAEYDTNGDKFADRNEIVEAMKKRMSQGGFGGGGQ